MVDMVTFWTNINIEVRGKEVLDSVEGPAVFIANHQVSIGMNAILSSLHLTVQ